LAARIHERHDGGGQSFADHEGGAHGQGGDDVEPHIAAPQVDPDLD